MPRLAANLSMMFNEVPFLDRFAAARKAGFEGVEFLFPYEYPAAELRSRLDRRGPDPGAVQHAARRLGEAASAAWPPCPAGRRNSGTA